MANKHETLTSLFSDIADSIREINGNTSDTYVADDFPDHIRNLGNNVGNLSNLVATQWTSKMEKILIPSLSNISCSITVKALTYYDGYWYGVGNDSSGNMYKLYGTTSGNLTATIFTTGRNYPATSIICDGTRIFIGMNSGGYDNTIMFGQTIANFRSTNTTFINLNNNNYHITDSCIVDGYNVLSGGYVNSQGAAIITIQVGSTNYKYLGYATYIPESFVSCCSFNGICVGITSSGYIGRITDVSTGSIGCKQFNNLKGVQKVRQMGNYLCVACVKDDGTYLYFTSGDPVTDEFKGFKITSDKLTIIGMAYVGGLYTLIGNDNNGKTKVWQTDDILNYGVYGHVVNITDGYTSRAMATDGTNICILADNGTYVQKALATIS